MMYAFERCQLDTKRYELRNNGQICKLEPRVFDVLMYLIQHRDHVVTREELLEHLRPGQYITEAVLNNCIMAARKAIGDSGFWQRIIKTVHGRGYHFIAHVEEQSPALPPLDTPALPEAPMAPAQQFQNGTASVSHGTTSPDEPGMFQDILAGAQVVVTVLCGTLETVDVLTQGLGVEVMQRLRQTFFALAHEEAKRYDGTLKFFGADGILMLFGMPRSQADHAQRAVCAARGLQQRLHERCTALEIAQPGDVTVRIDVHTGPMALNSMTDSAGLSSLAKAETTTLAIWLHYLATAGMLLISKATLPFVQDAVQCVAHGAVRIPGHAEPVMAYRIGG